jgi:hypothetical protein
MLAAQKCAGLAIGNCESSQVNSGGQFLLRLANFFASFSFVVSFGLFDLPLAFCSLFAMTYLLKE